ncbi:uncharacterized protein [Asterias amurensis]|uniref:uncharacterized protein isoform X2 n=1 Tax=Asterias amurensis TaxID=7602 RepID=UPI003AB3BF4E
MCKFWLMYICMMWWPGDLVNGDFNGPVDTTVKETDDVLFTCGSQSGVPITFGAWSDEDGIFASGGTLLKTTGKYSTFELVANYANGQYDLRINNADYEDQGTYFCQLGADPTKSAMLTVEAQVTSVTITVNGASGSPVEVMTSEEQTLVCTAFGARPRVGIDWTNDGTSISGDTETESVNGDTTDTISTLLYTPTRNDNGHQFRCVTTGQEAATPQSQSVTLNVQFAPVGVMAVYCQGTITCSSTANPTVANNQYVITLNDTETSTGKTLTYDPEMNGCTSVKCTATNAIGTATGSLADDLCPSPIPSCVCASTGVGAIIGALFGGIVIGAVTVIVIVVLMRRHRDRSTQRPDKAIIDGDDGHYEMSIEPPRNQQMSLAGPSVYKDNQPDGPMNEMTKPAVYESISENKMAAGSKSRKDKTYSNVGPELSFSRDLIVIENEIGRGAFGRVLLGTAQGIMGDGNPTKVAIKTLKDGADGQAKTSLLQELDLMKKVGSHPHVVNLLGYCVEKDPIYVIVEYLSKGDLKNVLIGCRPEDTGTGYSNIRGIGKSLSKTLIKFARDVASGMAFLSSQKCIHRDLAARNVLVSEDMVCKVADFGLARDVMNVRIYERESEGVLPMRWMALESLLDDVYTTESDVWSFGILLWEIVTLGARPYRLMTAKTMVAQLKEGYRMPKPRHCREELYSMMSSCWLQNPNKRPTFRSLFKQLEKSLTNEADYIKLGDLDENIYEVTKIGDGNEKL